MPPTDPRDSEIQRLQALDSELAAADAEFEHHLRRYGDRLEREGSDWGFGDEVKRLKKNRKRIVKERAEISERLLTLKTP